MYKIQLIKDILDGDMLDTSPHTLEDYLNDHPDFDPKNSCVCRATVQRMIELPFPPFIGLKLTGDFNDKHLLVCKIIDVEWDNYFSQFICQVNSDFPHKRWDYVYDYDHYLKQAEDYGWTNIDDSSD